MKRIRERTDSVGSGIARLHQTYRYDPSVVLLNTASITSSIGGLRRYERIEDVPDGKGSYNPVYHIRYRGFPRLVNGTFYESYQYQNDPPNRQFYAVSYAGTFGGGMSKSLLDTYMPPYPSELVEGLCYNAFLNATEQIPSDVSIPNFLYELREAKELIPKIDGFLHTISGGYLNLQFGWLPMLQDIRNFLGAADAVRRRIAVLKSMYNKVTDLHFGDEDFYHPPISTPPSKNSRDVSITIPADLSHPGRIPEYSFMDSYSADFHCKLKVFSTVSGLDEVDSFLKAMLTSLGFMNAPRVLWNAMPWSWLIEWFVKCGRLLDKFDNQPFPGSISVLESGYSIKETALFQVGAWLPRSLAEVIPPTQIAFTPCTTFFLQRYTRYSGLPLSGSLFNSGELSTFQKSILVALLEQRRK